MRIMLLMDIRIFSIFATVLLAITESSGQDFDHKCIHDRIAERHPPAYIPHLRRGSGGNARERRQANNYQPYRMAVHFVEENITNSSTVTPFLRDPTEGLELAVNYLQNVLSVIRAPNNLVITPRCATRNSAGQCTSIVEPAMCGDYVRVPDEHLGTRTVCDPTCHEVGGNGTGVDADYILYVTAVNDADCEGGTLAYATFCYADIDDDRSLAGYTNICPGGLQYAYDSTQAFFMLMLHEILHAVGFSSTDFDYFRDENGNRYSALTTLNINGEDVLAINSSRVLNYGRQYYSCPDLQGVLLENEGGDGSASSHWESRTLYFEVMDAALASSQAYYTSISNFTLNLLEDSGWYKVNYTAAASLYNYELLWGKGEGCNFITADCDTWQYSCSPQDVDGCSYDYQAASYCRTNNFHDGCYYFGPYRNGFCNSPVVPITNSCFPLVYSDGTQDGRCYNHQCYMYSGAQKPFYTVIRNDNTPQLCPYDGATLTFSDGSLTCPPADLTCSRNTPITSFDSTSNIPPSWCDDSCTICSRPASPAHCLTCNGSLTLRGVAPSVCTADACSGGTFLDSLSGNCTACAAGCRACTGPNNADCLACEDETLYRVTTNQPASSACVTAAECETPTISAFGDRICDMVIIITTPTSKLPTTPTESSALPTESSALPTESSALPTESSALPTVSPTTQRGGASSMHYHQFWLLVLLLVCLL